MKIRNRFYKELTKFRSFEFCRGRYFISEYGEVLDTKSNTHLSIKIKDTSKNINHTEFYCKLWTKDEKLVDVQLHEAVAELFIKSLEPNEVVVMDHFDLLKPRNSLCYSNLSVVDSDIASSKYTVEEIHNICKEIRSNKGTFSDLLDSLLKKYHICINYRFYSSIIKGENFKNFTEKHYPDLIRYEIRPKSNLMLTKYHNLLIRDFIVINNNKVKMKDLIEYLGLQEGEITKRDKLNLWSRVGRIRAKMREEGLL